MRKILSILTILAILWANFFAVQAGSVTKELHPEVEAAVELLSRLGVFSDVDLSTFASEKELSRGEFARYAAILVGASQKGGQNYFYDVPENHYAYTAVSNLVDQNVLSGDGEKRFEPDARITLQDACTILVRLLDYGPYAEENGGYPTGFLMSARRLGILKNVQANSVVTLGNAAVLLKNTLLTPVWEMDSIGADGTVTYKNQGELLLKRTFDLDYLIGRVTAVENRGLYGGRELENGKIEIDNRVYHTVEKDYSDFLGLEVSCIYCEEDLGSRALIWMHENGKEKCLDIYSDGENCTFDEHENCFTYWGDDGKVKKASIAQNATVIYNGENFAGSLSEIVKNRRYTLRLLSTGESLAYDLVFVTVYDIFKVDATVLATLTLYGDNQKIYELNPSISPWMMIQDQYGERIPFEKISEKTIVAVAKSVSGRTCRVLVNSKTISGRVEALYKNDGKNEIKIDGETYPCGGLMPDVKAGDSGVFYLDPFSYIYAVKKQADSMFLGYPIAIAKENQVFQNGIRMKVLTEDGEITEYKTASKVRIDGEDVEGTGEIEKYLCENGKMRHNLMSFRVNGKGEIAIIYTPAGKEEIRLDVSRDSVLYKNNSAKLGTKIAVNGETRIFCVPFEQDMETAKEEDFSVRKKKDLRNDTKYVAESYLLGVEPGDYADAVVIYGTSWGTASQDTAAIVLDSIYTSINGDGENVEAFSGFQGTSRVEFLCESGVSLAQYRSGDIVKVIVNSSGEVIELESLYRNGQNMDGSGYKNTFNSVARHMLVYVNQRIGSLIKVGYNSGKEFDEVFNLENAPIVIYDASAKGEKLRKGSYGEILSYSSTGKENHRMFIQCNYENIKMVVIYAEEE